MKRILTLIALLALTSCSPEEPPPVATPPRKTTPAPAPPQNPPAPPQEPPPAPPQPVVPPSEPARAKSRTVLRPDVPPPGVPRASGITGDIHLPAFTFRSVVGGGQIQIDGEFLGAIPCLWSITNAMEFDPKIRVETWPPEGAVKVGTTSHPENGSAEVWLDQSQNLAVRLPHLRPGEAVLYVDGKLGGKEVRGALRLFVEGYKNVVYTPLVNPEGEEASRYLRSIWFDRIQNE